jgi:hypothetical protein
MRAPGRRERLPGIARGPRGSDPPLGLGAAEASAHYLGRANGAMPSLAARLEAIVGARSPWECSHQRTAWFLLVPLSRERGLPWL